MDIERTKQIKFLLLRCKSLKENMIRTLNDSSTSVTGRYSSFKTYAEEYSHLAYEVNKVIDLSKERILLYDVNKMKGWADSVWPQQKEIIDSLVVYTDTLIAFLEKEIDFIDDEYTNLENFIKNKLRSSLFTQPEKEKEVQNTIEALFIGKGWNKGIDYDRETGKFEFSGKEYIPDFIVPKLNLCIEVKLLKEGRKSKVIEEINADITAYSKEYKRQIYVIYDLGVIRDEVEFKRDIENAKDDIKVIIIKH
ncbi:MAG: hypothetical protein ACI4HK_06470 [Ruminococcus sp.]